MPLADANRLHRRRFLSLGLAGASLALPRTPSARSQDSGPSSISTSPGARALPWIFPEVLVGQASDASGPTGVTILRFPRRLPCVVDVRGGSPLSLATDALRVAPTLIDAIVLSGGSIYGLAAPLAIAEAIRAERSGALDWDQIARVCGAVIYDFGLRKTAVTPTELHAKAALAAASARQVGRGPIGAGAGASCGKWRLDTVPEAAGQGAACSEIGALKLGVITIVNSLGAIYDRKGQVLRGHLDPSTKRRLDLPAAPGVGSKAGGHTTLSVLITNARLSAASLFALARQCHAAMARAIRPFNAASDGDIFFALSTETVELGATSFEALGHYAGELAWDAVLSSFDPD